MSSTNLRKRGPATTGVDNQRQVRSRTSASASRESLPPARQPLQPSRQTNLPAYQRQVKPAAPGTQESRGQTSNTKAVRYKGRVNGSRRSVRNWDKLDDQLLHSAVRQVQYEEAVAQGKSVETIVVPLGEPLTEAAWERAAKRAFPDCRYDTLACRYRWSALYPPVAAKGAWTEAEDSKLVSLVQKFGAENWGNIGQAMATRSGKQCRERWHNHANPTIKRGPFTEEEDELILTMFRSIGGRWAEMSKRLPGRPDNAIKNHFNTALSRRYANENPSSSPTRSSAPLAAATTTEPIAGCTPTRTQAPAPSQPEPTPLNQCFMEPILPIGQTPAPATAEGIMRVLRSFDASIRDVKSRRVPTFFQKPRFTTSVNLDPQPAFKPIKDPATSKALPSRAVSPSGLPSTSDRMERGSIQQTPEGVRWQPHSRLSTQPTPSKKAEPESLKTLASYAFLARRLPSLTPEPVSPTSRARQSSQDVSLASMPGSSSSPQNEYQSVAAGFSYPTSSPNRPPPFMPISFVRSQHFQHVQSSGTSQQPTSSSSHGPPRMAGRVFDMGHPHFQPPSTEIHSAEPTHQAPLASSPSLPPIFVRDQGQCRPPRFFSSFDYIVDQAHKALPSAETVMALCEAEMHVASRAKGKGRTFP